MSAPDPSQFGKPPDLPAVGTAFARLCEVIARLRSPTGCPWDRQQTLETIKPFTLEETYELLEAIDSKDDTAIIEELGDVLLQVVLDAQIGRDEEQFTETYALKVAFRSVLNLITGLVLLPLVSALLGRDIAGQLSGVKLYRQRT